MSFLGKGVPNLHPIILPLVPCPFWGYPSAWSQVPSRRTPPPPSQDWVGYTPWPEQDGVSPPSQDRMGTPLPWPGRDGVPPAGGMPLAFTQEDFLVYLWVVHYGSDNEVGGVEDEVWHFVSVLVENEYLVRRVLRFVQRCLGIERRLREVIRHWSLCRERSRTETKANTTLTTNEMDVLVNLVTSKTPKHFNLWHESYCDNLHHYRPHSEGMGKVLFSQVSVCPHFGGTGATPIRQTRGVPLPS